MKKNIKKQQDNYFISNCIYAATEYCVYVALGKPMGRITFIYGPSACGKSSLLSCVQEIRIDNSGEDSTMKKTFKEMSDDYILSIKKREGITAKAYPNVGLLLIDDIDCCIGKPALQASFAKLFKDLAGNNTDIIITSVESPDKHEVLIDELICCSSFKVLEMHQPDIELRKDVLKREMRDNSVHISSGVADYILHNNNISLAAICGCVIKIGLMNALENGTLDDTAIIEALKI